MCLYLSAADVVSETRAARHEFCSAENADMESQEGASLQSNAKHWQIVQVLC